MYSLVEAVEILEDNLDYWEHKNFIEIPFFALKIGKLEPIRKVATGYN
jgi:predicted transcriptional regulator